MGNIQTIQFCPVWFSAFVFNLHLIVPLLEGVHHKGKEAITKPIEKVKRRRVCPARMHALFRVWPVWVWETNGVYLEDRTVCKALLFYFEDGEVIPSFHTKLRLEGGMPNYFNHFQIYIVLFATL